MNKINLLENSLINKIAAGEVVERPASVIKELVENSIDAKAKNIHIEIKEGGSSFIKITDDGIGISKEQVKTAFLRHATSKIASLDDLENVLSLGFRGEALSSIASVSQIEFLTKTNTEDTGVKMCADGGEILSFENVAMTNGTTFIVKNIFFNTPARRKFLKKTAVESGYISDVVQKFAMGHPEISFTYKNNDNLIFKTDGNNDLESVLFSIYGKETIKNLLKISSEKNNIKISGFVGKPSISRANRSYEHLFVNGRFIKSEIVNQAIENAFKTRLMVGKFPFFVLFLEIPPYTIDVNVHPTKLQVRFAHEEEIYSIFYEAVKNALDNENLITTVELTESPKKNFSDVSPSIIPSFRQAKISDIIYNKPSTSLKVSEDYNLTQEKPTEKTEEKKEVKPEIKLEAKPETKPETKPEIKPTQVLNKEKELAPKEEFRKSALNYKIVGQIFNSYFIIEYDQKIFFIDQHAAHERVLYESFLNKAKSDKILSQQLIVPIIVKFNDKEADIYIDNEKLFQKLGFDIEFFGKNTYAIRSVPYIVKGDVSGNFFMNIIDKLSEIGDNIENITDLKEEIIALKSCKEAVKANDKLSYNEAKALIEDLLRLENPFSCPHGRPVVVEISKYEIEKMFKRV